MRKMLLTLALVSVSSVGCAQLTPNEVGGAVIGGLAGSQVGGGNGRLAATAAGAVLGANIGRQIPPPVYQPVIPTAPRGYPPGYAPPYVYGSPSMYDRPEYRCENEQYIDGVYNPPAAQAYCHGRLDRERQQQQRYEAESYERGRRGLK